MQRQTMAFCPFRNEKYVTDFNLWQALTSSPGTAQYVVFSSLCSGRWGEGGAWEWAWARDLVPSPGVKGSRPQMIGQSPQQHANVALSVGGQSSCTNVHTQVPRRSIHAPLARHSQGSKAGIREGHTRMEERGPFTNTS